MSFNYQYPQADSFPIFSNGIPTTQSTLHQLGWSGYPINTIGSKYTNIDEGVSNPNDNDIIYKSGLRDEINTLHTLNLDFGRAYVVPSSVQVNIRVNISGADSGDAGNLYVRSIDLYNNKSEIIANYMTGPGSPVYSWSEGSQISNQSIILSGSPWNFNSAYIDKLSCNIQLSGAVTGNPNLDNFRLAIYAVELLSSGSVGVETSGLPLFISGPRQVTECLTVIDASGYPINPDTPSGVWLNSVVGYGYVETNNNWWQSVQDGVHNPTDTSYITPLANSILLPIRVSSIINTSELTSWTDHNGQDPATVGYDNWVKAVNSGLTNPVDASYIQSNSSTTLPRNSPGFVFRKPFITCNQTRFGFRCKKVETNDVIYVSSFYLRNSNNTILNQWTASNDAVPITTSLGDYKTSFASTNYNDWTQDNYITFCVSHTGTPPLSGNFLFSEIQLETDFGTVKSPSFYFHAPTMNNYSGGVNFCLRISNNGTAYQGGSDYLTIQNILWKNDNGDTIATFNNVNITPSSTFTNYCSSGYAFQKHVFDRNSITFDLTKQSTSIQHTWDEIFISELEICVTGLDPVHSSYVPLYTFGAGLASSGLDLYIQGHSTSSSGIDLYISGPFPSNSSTTLYAQGYSTINSGVPLYIGGLETYTSGIPLLTTGAYFATSGIPLYIAGPIPQSSWMPLFLKADNIPSINGNVPLFTYSTTNSGLFSKIPLYIGGSGDTNAGMILFLKNEEAYSTSSTMPLFLKTIGNLDGSMTVESGVPLFVGNYYTAVNSGLSLYINNSQQGTSGYIPMSSWMPLYIARDSEGTANRIDLYLKVADVASGIVPLYTFGAYTINSGIPLTISNTHAVNSSTLQLYSHGH